MGFGNIQVICEYLYLKIIKSSKQTFLHDQHRFYGESLPFGDDSYSSAETEGYLTSTQALADFAILITSLKRNLSAETAPVVVFGGSYGGSKSPLNIIITRHKRIVS